MKKHNFIIRTVSVFLFIVFLQYSFYLPVFSYGEVFHNHKNQENKIAITFDDGPHPRYTLPILDVLAKYNVRATFFIVGENVRKRPDALIRMVGEGHEIGSHTFTHEKIDCLNLCNLLSELENTEKAIAEVVSIKPKLLRPPEGKCTEIMKSAAHDMGYSLIMWDIDTRDWDKNTTIQAIKNKILNSVHSGSIILFHDFVSRKTSITIEALDTVLPQLIELGYQFVTVSELLTSN